LFPKEHFPNSKTVLISLFTTHQLLRDGDMLNKSISFGTSTNTANQIGYLDYTDTSCRFSGFFSYNQEIFLNLFTLSEQPYPHKKTLTAIEESKHPDKLPVFNTIDELLKTLEN